jgi:sugar (pentulose or hexulose) kinase
MAPPTATEAPPQESAKKGGVGRGLVRGAAVGQIAGGDSESTLRGAAAGAAIGGMRRRDQKRKEEAARQQWQQEQQHIYAENRNRYNRAYAACLEGKDYTVR